MDEPKLPAVRAEDYPKTVNTYLISGTCSGVLKINDLWCFR